MSRWIQDAGHGGKDTGAVKYGQNEKEWTLEAAIYVNERLNELGVSSTLTRTEDVTLSRDNRTEKVREYDKAISHHFNAGGGTGAEFIHSIYASGSFEEILKEEFQQAGYPVRRTFTRKYPNNDELDYYYMHRETGSTRVTIVEYGFLDGPNRDQLQEKNYRIGMYESVIRAICREEGIAYKEKNNDITSPEVLYRVISGSFSKKENAEQRVEDLKNAGFDAFIDRFEP
ncbi:N-acetylmuramoyl-L-alanine amidase [Filobacillus milosensis]|uniref:N-acetylmuramoyl-L-alanine amidase n=1 Tax=Filobacillus milosensis TaxID=94137 RepID=UPI0018917FBA|nr:N-acetylmuramoyl-L-alanine amidase [Filobacillus milosensis]